MPAYVEQANFAHARGGCYRCSRADRLVDSDAFIEGEGALVLCVPCLHEMAQAAGLTFNRAAFNELQEQLALAKAKILDLSEAPEDKFLNLPPEVYTTLVAWLERLDEAPKASEVKRCSQTTTLGNPCKMSALPDSDTCQFHKDR